MIMLSELQFDELYGEALNYALTYEVTIPSGDWFYCYIKALLGNMNWRVI